MEEHIGKIIGRLREERGLSKKRLARESGISDAYLVQIEQGVRRPSEKVMRSLAAGLRVAPTALLVPAGVFEESYLVWPRQIADGYVQDFENRHGHEPDRDQREALLTAAITKRDQLVACPDDEDDKLTAQSEILALIDDPVGVVVQPDFGAEGWNELSEKDQRMVQQLINRLRSNED